METDLTIGFELVDIPFGYDSDGNLIKSAIVKWKPGEGKAKQSTAKAGRPNKSMNLLMEALRVAIDETGTPVRPSADSPIIRAASEEAVRRRFDVRMAERAKAGEDPAKLGTASMRQFQKRP
jgi:hypothetical protein